MLALRKTKPESGVNLVDMIQPSPGFGEVLIAVVASGICGTDLHAEKWTDAYAFMTERMPVTLGHEFSGRIASLGDRVVDLAIGDRVTVWPTIACGRCPACQAREPHDCENTATIGLHQNGAFASYVVAPAGNVFKLPDTVDFELAALTEPLTVSAYALENAGMRPGQSVVVLGPGAQGFGAAWLARQAGASPVILVGLNDQARLACARSVGIEHVVDIQDTVLLNAVHEIAGGKVDVVIEATGAAQSINDGLQILKRGGILMAVGIHARPVTIDLTTMVRAKHQLRTSHGSRRATWDQVLGILATHGEEIRGMITHRFPLRDAVAGFQTARQGAAVKVILQTE